MTSHDNKSFSRTGQIVSVSALLLILSGYYIPWYYLHPEYDDGYNLAILPFILLSMVGGLITILMFVISLFSEKIDRTKLTYNLILGGILLATSYGSSLYFYAHIVEP